MNLEVEPYAAIHEWLREQATALHISAKFHMHLVRPDNGWLYIPVYIEGDLDAYDKASRLQDLEDAWNDQVPKPDRKLLLIPAAN